jgi:hypothetical protein
MRDPIKWKIGDSKGRYEHQQPKEDQDPTDYAVNVLGSLPEQIAKIQAVLYAGAGLSASARYPDWSTLLEILQREAENAINNVNEIDRDYFKELAAKSKNLELGDWLHEFLDNRLAGILSDLFGKGDKNKKEPSAVHHYLARMPFSLAITTNYDRLLESAYDAVGKDHGSWTWQDTDDVLKWLNEDKFGVLHAHGVYDKSSSIIITGRQYAKQAHSHKRFGGLLKWLLMTRTFLFVGARLDDPDLVYQLQEGFAEQGQAFGPHYAMVPYDEAPELRREILWKNLHVKLVPVGSPSQRSVPGDHDWRTIATAKVLRRLSGKVALKRYELQRSHLPTSDDPCFSLLTALKSVLDEAVEQTDSFRGDVCLSPDGVSSHLSGRLRYTLSTEGRTDPTVKNAWVLADSICGISYYQSAPNRGVYLKSVDTKEIAEESNLGHYGNINYKVGYPDVKSELALPIEADGVRVGVLNLESKLVDAYTDDHQKVARWLAEKAGRLYAATYERQRRGSRLDPVTEPVYGELEELGSRLWSIARNGGKHAGRLALLIYKADYETGELRSQDPNRTIFGHQSCTRDTSGCESPRFYYDNAGGAQKSIVARVFADGRPRFYTNVAEAVRRGEVTDKYSAALQLAGPLIAFPVIIRGHIAGVIVAWFLNGEGGDLDGRDVELFRRAAHLIANAPRTPTGALTSFQPPFSAGKQEPRDTHGLMTVNRIKGILTCLEHRSNDIGASGSRMLNDLGVHFRSAVGNPVRDFLSVLKQHEKEFPSRSTKPAEWISPLRCRCWVRAQPGASGKPRFVLALQISLGADDPDRNLRPRTPGSQEYHGIAMEPLTRPGIDARIRTDLRRAERIAANPAHPYQDDVCVQGFEKFSALVFDDNVHFSFLLSRVSAYRFSFQQRPGIHGEDVMAAPLEKDPDLPWYVAPLIVPDLYEWNEDAAAGPTRPIQDRLAGYLTFDSGRWNREQTLRREEQPKIVLTQEWAELQNNMLHEIELFSACLVQHECFKKVLPTPSTRLPAMSISVTA